MPRYNRIEKAVFLIEYAGCQNVVRSGQGKLESKIGKGRFGKHAYRAKLEYLAVQIKRAQIFSFARPA